MMQDIAILADDIGKTYRIGRTRARYQTLRESISDLALAPIRRIKSSLSGSSVADPGETIWALKNISFEITRGEIVGIIGRNGAGKSTLLKILSSITEPTVGSAQVHGRIGSLLEVGTGFHPELTGRENIYLNGAILGMRRSEINSKFDEIIAFSEIDKFLDTPVKHYSSGMYLRLAFAVAAHLETEILLVDEVLAVGDIKFQKKCTQKMEDFSSMGQTVLVVSHNLRVIETLTSSCIYLKDGKVKAMGNTKSVIMEYQRDVLSNQVYSQLPSELLVPISNPVIKVSKFTFINRRNNKEVEYFESNLPVTLTCILESNYSIENVVVHVRYYKEHLIISSNNSNHTMGNLSIERNKRYQLNISMEGIRLIPGNYSVVLFILPNYFSAIGESLSDIHVKNFVVQGSRELGGGFFSIKQKWDLIRI